MVWSFMLRLADVSKDYAGGTRALRNVSLEIPRGMFGLLGPNGAGKSTLMRTISTLQAPDSGTITFNGIDVLREKTALRRVLGYLPQEFGSYPRISAETMLRHLAALKGLHGSQQSGAVEQLLVRTNLWEARKRSVDGFSGGMKRRFGIAQALLGDPQLLIVDEPTAGLDPAERRRFQNLLAEVSQETVVILSTHIVEDVAELCPRLAIMGRGSILRQGAPQTLIATLQGKLWTMMATREHAALMRQQQTVLSCRLRGGQMEVRVLADTAPAGMSAASPDLEDVYFATLHEHGLTTNLE
jgi:ABC-2 type transport system ATP-binding protein